MNNVENAFNEKGCYEIDIFEKVDGITQYSIVQFSLTFKHLHGRIFRRFSVEKLGEYIRNNQG